MRIEEELTQSARSSRANPFCNTTKRAPESLARKFKIHHAEIGAEDRNALSGLKA